MNKETQDLAWACLPKEVRSKMSEYYRTLISQKKEYISLNFENACVKVKERMVVLEQFFGSHNLTSSTEPDEVLTILRKDIIEEFNQATADLSRTGNLKYKGKRELLKNLFRRQVPA